MENIRFSKVGKEIETIKANFNTKVNIHSYGDDEYIIGVSKKGGPSVLIEKIFKNYDDAFLFATREAKRILSGVIPNNYFGKTPQQIWASWTDKQRLHFLNDNRSEILVKHKASFSDSIINTYSEGNYESLDYRFKDALEHHVKEGQYAKGGIIKTIWNFLNEKVHFNI